MAREIPLDSEPADARPSPLRIIVGVAWMASGLAMALLFTVRPSDPLPAESVASAPWTVEHVLVGSSSASRRVAENLLAHPPDPRAIERIVWVGLPPEDLEPRAVALGYRFEVVADTDPRGRSVAPTLRITGPDARVVYEGGYSARPRSPTTEDRRILEALIAGQPVEPLPSGVRQG